MDYLQTLDWLFQQLASFQRVGQSAYNEDLGNINAICSLLNHPQNNFKSIHVAGTNGKGSTSHLIASVLQEQGYKVGLYTSPHLKDFRERIKVNGEMISKKEVVDFVNAHKDDFNEIGLSFFEMSTALAFAYFSDQKVDVAVIEVGLGGRLDATNIINPELSVITNVAFDHQHLLGDTIALIAKEKAGIIKEGVPVVLGATSEEVRCVVAETAVQKDSKLILSSKNTSYESGLLGACQQENTDTVCIAIEQFRLLGWNVSEASLKLGLLRVVENTSLRGRWEQISLSPRVICDTGHNPHAMRSIVKQLNKMSYNKLWMVIGMVGDKDVSAILELLPKDANYIFCQPNIPRSLSVNDLFNKAAQYSLKGQKTQNPLYALAEARKQAQQNDLIFVGGSTFVVAEIL
jgi:dihydrofolate synthase / folylpolyglutamate synthase